MGQLINHTLANIAGGVSEQFEEARFETQVEEMINCIPSISKGIVRRNPLKFLSKILDVPYSDIYMHTYNRGDGSKYIVGIGNGAWGVIDGVTGTLINRGTSTYLELPVGYVPRTSFSTVTVGDFTFVLNKTKTIRKAATIDGTVDSHLKTGVYWIKKTSNVVTQQDPNTGSATIEGYRYVLNGVGVTSTNTTSTLRGEQIAASLAAALGTGYVASGPVVYKKNMNVSDTWEWSDSFGNEASFGFKGKAKALTDLPINLPIALNGLIVNVTGGTEGQFDDFYLRYENQTWEETRKPGMANTLDASTMPHCFVRGSDGNFYLSEYTSTSLQTIPGLSTTEQGWKPRQVGNEDTAPDPSFIDKKGTDILFYKNRLCIIADDSVVLSELGEYGNFYATTVRGIPDTDPIDLVVASTTVANIFGAVPTSNSLILFSDTAQYVLTSGGQALTPQSAQIEVASRYNVSNKCKPIGLGNKVFFTASSGDNTQLFAYQINEGQLPTSAVQLSTHIPNYLPKNVELMIGHSILGYIFMWSKEEADTIYVLNISDNGQQLTQIAFHKWVLPTDLEYMSIVDNELLIMFKEAGDIMNISKTTLESKTIEDAEVYTDTIGTKKYPYTSRIIFTKFYLKDGNNNGNKNGRIILRTATITVKKGSKFKVILNTPYLVREYINDEKVSILSNSDAINLQIDSIDNNPFEIKTINYEGYYHSRSQRY